MGFEKNGMVYISQSSVQGQIFHWHDELELLLVVEGSIDLKVGYGWFRLEQGDIMLINSDEIHSIKETEEKNRIICVSSFFSPGPLVPMPPACLDRDLPKPVSLGSLYASWAYST